MEDYAKTYFATLVCSRPDGKAQAKRVRVAFPSLISSDSDLRFCVIRISCIRSSARSLRSLCTLRENFKEGIVHFEQIHILRVTSIYRTVPIAQGQTKMRYNKVCYIEVIGLIEDARAVRPYLLIDNLSSRYS